MRIAADNRMLKTSGGRGSSSAPLLKMKKWLSLLMGILIIWIVVFVIAPFFQDMPSIKPLSRFIDERGIDASALYYTEVEEASEAELNLRSGIKYRPVGP